MADRNEKGCSRWMLCLQSFPRVPRKQWTDQEVGVSARSGRGGAASSGGARSYGSWKFQGIPEAKKLGQVVDRWITALLINPRTRSRFIACLVETASSPHHIRREAATKLGVLERAEEISGDYLTRFRTKRRQSACFKRTNFMERVNSLVSKGTAPNPVKVRPVQVGLPDEDIPF